MNTTGADLKREEEEKNFIFLQVEKKEKKKRFVSLASETLW
jgi:hypothetical protein